MQLPGDLYVLAGLIVYISSVAIDKYTRYHLRYLRRYCDTKMRVAPLF